MNIKRYKHLKRLINEGKWNIDLESGIVTSKSGSTGYKDSYGRLYFHTKESYKDYNFYIHEIIAVAGGLYPVNLQIDHINENKLDNRLCNLQVLKAKDNNRKSHHKLTQKEVEEIKLMLQTGDFTGRVIAWLYGVAPTTVSKIKNNQCWSDIGVCKEGITCES